MVGIKVEKMLLVLHKAELAEKQMEDEWLDLQSEFKSCSEEYWKVESWM